MWHLIICDNVYRIVRQAPQYSVILKSFEDKNDAVNYFYDNVA